MRLTLFFTRGVSLQDWDEAGILERELSLYRKLAAAGVAVSLVTYGGPGDLAYSARLAGIDILCNRWALPARLYAALLPLLHARHLRRADALKTNQLAGGDLALRAARLWRKPLVARCGYLYSDFSARHFGPRSAQARSAAELERRVFGGARKILVATEAMASEVRRRLPAAASRVEVQPNYVDTGLFAPMPGQRKEFDVAFVGRLVPQKNLAALLEAVSGLGLRALFVGDGELREEVLMRRRERPGLIRWERRLPNGELPRWLSRARVFVLPSAFEGQPKALMEAMACGMAVIGADSPGIRDLLIDEETGVLCPPDARGLRDALRRLLSDAPLRAALGAKARRFAVERFSLDRVASREISLLAEAAR